LRPLTKTQQRQVGVFCFGGVGCSALRPAQGALTPPLGTKHPHLLCGTILQGLRIKEIAITISSFFLFG